MIAAGYWRCCVAPRLEDPGVFTLALDTLELFAERVAGVAPDFTVHKGEIAVADEASAKNQHC